MRQVTNKQTKISNSFFSLAYSFVLNKYAVQNWAASNGDCLKINYFTIVQILSGQ
jgi:hypothetical protein